MIVRTASTASQLGSESLRKGQKGVMEAFVGGHDVFAALPLPAMEKVCAIYWLLQLRVFHLEYDSALLMKFQDLRFSQVTHQQNTLKFIMNKLDC